MAKEKEVSGVKDEPKEGSNEGRDDSEADRQPAENGFSKGDVKANNKADAEPAGEEAEAEAAAGEGHFRTDVSVSIYISYPPHPFHYKSAFGFLAAHMQWLLFRMATVSDPGWSQFMRIWWCF